MSAPSHDCDRYREELLLGRIDETQALREEGACGSCREWAQRARQVSGLLSSLERHPAPAELDEVLAGAIETGAAGQEPLLRGLERHRAPAELEAALALDLAHEPGPTTLVEALVRRSAPDVLDRLVDEELRDPAADTRRHVRGLFRLEGPRALTDRVDRELRVPVPVRRRMGQALGGLAAAAVLAVSLVPLIGGTEEVPRLRFEVVQVTDLGQLDPIARSLVEGLAGGRVNDVQPSTDPAGGSMTDGGGR